MQEEITKATESHIQSRGSEEPQNITLVLEDNAVEDMLLDLVD